MATAASKLTKEKKNALIAEGQKARDEGKSLKDCPYVVRTIRELWLQGWKGEQG
jgi:ribosome modulation factor